VDRGTDKTIRAISALWVKVRAHDLLQPHDLTNVQKFYEWQIPQLAVA
jgi:hypothetical protein